MTYVNLIVYHCNDYMLFQALPNRILPLLQDAVILKYWKKNAALIPIHKYILFLIYFLQTSIEFSSLIFYNNHPICQKQKNDITA